jgi:hypothetical protein
MSGADSPSFRPILTAMSNGFEFNDLAHSYTQLKENGIALQQQGVDLVRIADSGIANIAPLEKFVTFCLDLSKEHPEVTPAVQSLINSGTHTIVLLDKANANLSAALPSINTSLLNAISATSGSNVAAATAVETILDLVPTSRDVIFRAWPERGLARSYGEENLDAYLTRFDGDLPRRRRGAWQAYYSISEDAVAQASHTMRDILAKIIAKEAANDKIEACPWYQERKVRDPHTNPSIKDRVRFLLFGPSKQGIDQLEMDNIEVAVNLYVNEDCTLKSIAHGSSSFSKEKAKLSMEHIEELLFLILNRLYKST